MSKASNRRTAEQILLQTHTAWWSAWYTWKCTVRGLIHLLYREHSVHFLHWRLFPVFFLYWTSVDNWESTVTPLLESIQESTERWKSVWQFCFAVWWCVHCSLEVHQVVQLHPVRDLGCGTSLYMPAVCCMRDAPLLAEYLDSRSYICLVCLPPAMLYRGLSHCLLPTRSLVCLRACWACYLVSVHFRWWRITARGVFFSYLSTLIPIKSYQGTLPIPLEDFSFSGLRTLSHNINIYHQSWFFTNFWFWHYWFVCT